MDAGGGGRQSDAEGGALLHQLRLFQPDVCPVRQDDAVATCPGVGQGLGDPVVFRLDGGQLRQQPDEIGVGADGGAGPAAQGVVVQLLRQSDAAADGAGGQLHGFHGELADLLQLVQGAQGRFRLGQGADGSAALQKALVQPLADGTVLLQGLHPTGQPDADLPQGEGVEQILQQIGAALGTEGLTVGDGGVDAEQLLQLSAQLGGGAAHGIGGVDDGDEGLSCGLDVPDGLPLGLHIVTAGDVGDGAVRCDHDADGGVVLHDLFGPQLRGLGHGDGRIGPGG